MAIPILNHLDLRSVSQLQNAILHKTTSGNASDIEAKIIYDTGANAIKFYNGSQWITLGAEEFSFKTISVSGQSNVVADSTTDTLTFVAGNNVTITTSAADDSITIASAVGTEEVQDIVGDQFVTNGTHSGISASYDDAGDGAIDLTNTDKGSAQNIFKTVAVSGQSNIVADSNSDTLTFAAGSNITLTTNASTDTVTIASTDTNTDTLQSIADSSSSSEQFVTFVANASGAQTGLSDAAFKYIPSTGTLKVTNLIVEGDTTTANETVKIVENNTLEFEGAAGSGADDELKLTTATLTADRTQTLQDATGTIALTSDIPNVFSTISVSGQSDVVADTSSDTLTLAAGSNVTITTNATSDTVTIASTDTNTQLATASALIEATSLGTNSTASFTHGLNSKNLIVQMYDVTTGLVAVGDIDHTSNSAITITFATPASGNTLSNDIRVVVIDAKNGLTDKTVTYA